MLYKQKIFYFNCFIIIIGFISGAASVIYCGSDSISSLKVSFFSAFTSDKMTIAINALIENSAVITFLLLCGFSLVGFVFILPTVYLSSYHVGLYASLAFMIYSFRGGMFIILMLLPTAFLSLLLISLSSTEAIRLNLHILFNYPKRREVINEHIFTSLILIALSAVLIGFRTYVTPLLFDYFKITYYSEVVYGFIRI